MRVLSREKQRRGSILRDVSADLVEQQRKLFMTPRESAKAHPFNFTKSPATPQTHSLQKLANSFHSNRFVLSARQGELQLNSTSKKRILFTAEKGKGRRSVGLKHNARVNAFEICYPEGMDSEASAVWPPV